MSEIIVRKYNNIYATIDCDKSILQELSEYFSFYAENYKFVPSYRNKMWDGKIRLFDIRKRSLYLGLYKHIEQFCEEREYTYTFDGINQTDLSNKDFDKFIESLNIPMKLHDHQYNTILSAIRETRGLWISPTSSGKSLMIYALTQFYKVKTLVIVPTTALVIQLSKDFADYGYKDNTHKVYSGQDKYSDEWITISTWQSAISQDQQWFDQYQQIIVDEAHLAKAKSIKSILERMPDCQYRYGFTGTLDGTETNKLVLEGLFGPTRIATTTFELMEKGIVAQLKIYCIVLKYPDELRKIVVKGDYPEEMNIIVSHPGRNNFIKKLCESVNGNTLLLFQYVEKHGKLLYEAMKDLDRNVYYIHGGVDGEDRDAIREIVEKDNNALIIASYGTLSLGVSIKNLHNVIFASPSKARIKNLQSIGRGLRISDTKKSVKLFDIADDFSWKKKNNYTLDHFIERVNIYSSEKFVCVFHNKEMK